MNIFIVALIISAATALFAVLIKQKNQDENNTSYAVKIFMISFVCSYFSMMYFITPACPEILQGEPDF